MLLYYDKYDQCRRVEIVNLVVFKFCVLFIVDGFLWINTGIFQIFLKTYIVAYSKMIIKYTIYPKLSKFSMFI